MAAAPATTPGGRHADLKRAIGLGASAVAATVLLPVRLCAAPRAGAQTGGAQAVQLMRAMTSAYHALNSYAAESHITQQQKSGGKTLQQKLTSVSLRYLRPNLLRVDIRDAGGVLIRSAVSNGKTLNVYSTTVKRYQPGPAAPTLAGLLGQLQARGRIFAELDPLFFLSGASLPPTVTELNTAKQVLVRGRLCDVVTGMASLEAAPALRRTASMRWKWYIDHESHLLDRVTARSSPTKIMLQTDAAGHKQPVTVTVTVDDLVVLSRPNAPLTQAGFAR